jgi:hypothetical protein
MEAEPGINLILSLLIYSQEKDGFWNRPGFELEDSAFS